MSTHINTMTITTICSSSVIGQLLEQGLEPTLASYPELANQRGLLEEILAVDGRLNDLEREAGDLSRRLDELGGELADCLGEPAA